GKKYANWNKMMVATGKRMRKDFTVPAPSKGPVGFTISNRDREPPQPGRFYHFEDAPVFGAKLVKDMLVAAAYVIPEPVTIDSIYTSPEDKREWNNYANSTSVADLDKYMRRNPKSPFMATAKERRKEIYDNEIEEYRAARKKNTLSGYGNYLDSFPDAHNKNAVLKRMVKKMSKRATYSLYAETHPETVKFFPKAMKLDFQLMRIGPNGMTVRDILSHAKGGLGLGMLSAKIKATNGAYKDFTIGEIKHLKKRGMKDKLIEAMINSTTEHNRQMKAAKQNKQMMAQIQELIKNSQKNVGSSSSSSSSAANKNMPVECLKLKAALTACSQAGGFLAMACKATARASFTCSMNL
ncbi:MAG: hypothetical protein HOM21_17710, partial [Halobacteriovoraceae bacterium]|nr:hypothetical protein [Halobacteriovoraceae bacterium]